ncbi:sensor domain-containing diguanylate cyclase [Pseudooctadecabacter sp.]|uniref:GGDEF domain-containing protein n=1 Tax=Pseudooctadecabacter sp. TaxID=1966338 RepID=UPI0025F31FAC|nr:diguanylate cyclase [Pseudooctadecabacter sp.]
MTDLMKMTTTFVDAIALIMALILMISLLQRGGGRPLRNKAVMGALFSFALVMSMSDPIILPNNTGIFDMRALLVGTAAALLGPIAGAITLGVGILYRAYIGQPGVVPAVVGMATVFAMGCLWRVFIKDLNLAKWAKSLILGILLSSQGVAIFATPQAMWADLFTNLFPYMVVSSVLGSLLIHYLITGEFSFISEAQASMVNANTDHLTGLLNRRGLDLTYPQLNSKLPSTAGRALLYFDVDRFKQTNDTYGHSVGDDVLRHVVKLVSNNLRMDDVFVRLGGDEFAVILPNIDAQEAETIAERCREVVSNAGFEVDCDALPLSISVGAVWMRSPVEIDKMLEAADRALYQAKSKGRNAVVFLAGLKVLQGAKDQADAFRHQVA